MFPQPRMLPDDAGMVTAEYAIGTIVAAMFAAVLFAVITSDSVFDMITGVIEDALSVKF